MVRCPRTLFAMGTYSPPLDLNSIAPWCQIVERNGVLVQPEIERGRSPLVSIPPFGGDFQGIDTTTRLSPQHGCVPQPRFYFACQDHCSSTMPIRLNFRLDRHSESACAKTSEVQFDFVPQKSGHEGVVQTR
jgi:hypothetical protein